MSRLSLLPSSWLLTNAGPRSLPVCLSVACLPALCSEELNECSEALNSGGKCPLVPPSQQSNAEERKQKPERPSARSESGIFPGLISCLPQSSKSSFHGLGTWSFVQMSGLQWTQAREPEFICRVMTPEPRTFCHCREWTQQPEIQTAPGSSLCWDYNPSIPGSQTLSEWWMVKL